MKIIIFNDKDNSDRSLERLNYSRPEGDKRFWRFEEFHQLVFKKVKSILEKRTPICELNKIYMYTGEYNPKALNSMKKVCGDTIRDLNELINKENSLLQKIYSMTGNEQLKEEVKTHVNTIKQRFEELKQIKIEAIEKTKQRSEGQMAFFQKIRETSFIELRTTPLVNRNGFIQQKGVDVKLATDLIQLGHANAYDVAVLLTGDADLKESIKLVKERLGKIIILLAYYSNDQFERRNNTIGDDLLPLCDYFINTKDFTEDDISMISERKIMKENNETT